VKYNKQTELKNGKTLIMRSGTAEDAEQVLSVFLQAHAETDYLLTYPEENTFTAEQEAEFLQNIADSGNEIELLAIIDGKVVGSAGITALGTKYKIKHRADFGISVLREYWGMGIGRALTLASIECARNSGYTQVELTVAAENKNAVALYESVGYVEYGRNPRGFKSKISGYQEIIYMRMEL